MMEHLIRDCLKLKNEKSKEIKFELVDDITTIANSNLVLIMSCLSLRYHWLTDELWIMIALFMHFQIKTGLQLINVWIVEKHSRKKMLSAML